MVNEQDFIELRLEFGDKSSCFARLIFLLLLPLLIFMVVIGGYMDPIYPSVFSLMALSEAVSA